jgi:hypothetical protein
VPRSDSAGGGIRMVGFDGGALGTDVEAGISGGGEFGRSADGTEGTVVGGTSDTAGVWTGLTPDVTSSSESSELNPS